MEVKVEITTDQLLDVLKTFNENGNIGVFVKDINGDYYLFEKIIRKLKEMEINTEDLISLIYDTRLNIIDKSEEIDKRYIEVLMKINEDKILIYDYSI